MPHGRFRRGIYLLPTLFTVGNLLCGFSAVIYVALGRLDKAALLIVIAGILDGLDGRIARLTGTTSDFGLEFDSLADIVSFGVAPAFLAHQWALIPLGRVGWLFAFLYVVSTAMRLARFNIRTTAGSKRYFAGLPCPPAAGLIACIVFLFPDPPGKSLVIAGFAALVVTAAGLMLSRIRYRSFKDLDLRNRRSYIYVLVVAAVLALVVKWPQITLLSLAAVYFISGPMGSVVSAIARVTGRAPADEKLSGAGGEVPDESATR